MKIIGQSTIATTPPYVHLGYLATTVVRYSSSAIGAGLSLITIGVVLGFRVRRAGRARLTGKSGPYRRFIAYIIAGFCLVCTGIGMLMSL